MSGNTEGYVVYECLHCGKEERVFVKKKEYVEVTVCPGCNGAFVDKWCTLKYRKGVPSNNSYGNPKHVNDSGSKLLVIELDDIDSVPRVFYKGEEIKSKIHVGFDYRTRGGKPLEGGNAIHIEHANKGSVNDIRTVKHKPWNSEGR
ncbi:hypothetical protein GI584_14315 [Gracilibacillus salitolerans]|uniref:Uncharacterized protein n=1 Tax=Gracilibacillus salitolerans TaxID=2663022 RepID=A0A5Q2TK80_9BACI|nr:hypothetical protein [Gracilibacillus salitolerans]QGH35146.1 hypothetical protein GI584_14315 [Gracilibacillus salitolerans]